MKFLIVRRLDGVILGESDSEINETDRVTSPAEIVPAWAPRMDAARAWREFFEALPIATRAKFRTYKPAIEDALKDGAVDEARLIIQGITSSSLIATKEGMLDVLAE